MRDESQEGQAIGWRPLGHQSSNKREDRGDPQNAALGLFLSDPRPHTHTQISMFKKVE